MLLVVSDMATPAATVIGFMGCGGPNGPTPGGRICTGHTSGLSRMYSSANTSNTPHKAFSGTTQKETDEGGTYRLWFSHHPGMK